MEFETFTRKKEDIREKSKMIFEKTGSIETETYELLHRNETGVENHLQNRVQNHFQNHVQNHVQNRVQNQVQNRVQNFVNKKI